MFAKNGYIILFVLALFTIQLLPQTAKLKVVNGKDEALVRVIIKNSVVFVAANELASAIDVNFYYNKKDVKTEFKFDEFSLKFSAKNPYVVKTIKGERPQIIQFPLFTQLSDDKIYLPLEQVMPLFEEGLGEKLNFNKTTLVLTVGSKIKTAVKKKEEKQIPKVEPEKAASTEKEAITFSEKANGTLITIRTKKNKPESESSYKNNVIAVTIKNEILKYDEIEKIPANSLVKSIKVKKQDKSTVILFELHQGYDSHEITEGEDSKSLLLTIRNKKFAHNNSNSAKKVKWDFDVIVIDAGHGGKDYGAVGINGLREKDVNLAVALKLGKMIESKINGVKVVYTRKSDTFVELYKRGKIANEKSGKLFISIHCNSTPQKQTDATGTEIYLLRPGRTENAIKIAERENSVIKLEDNPAKYQKLTDENFILVSMAHSSYMKYSEKFSDYLNTNFMNNQQLKSRGIKQAGFYVLVGASMPGVLVESGFISNKNDSKILGSSEGQNKIATSVFEAVKKFKEYYDKVIETES